MIAKLKVAKLKVVIDMWILVIFLVTNLSFSTSVLMKLRGVVPNKEFSMAQCFKLIFRCFWMRMGVV